MDSRWCSCAASETATPPPLSPLADWARALVALPLTGGLVYTLHDAVVILFQGLLQMPVAIALFMSGARFIPAAEVALFSLIETVLGPLWAWIGVGEVPGTLAVVGGMIVVGAVAGNATLGLLRAKKRETTGLTPSPDNEPSPAWEP